MDTKSLRCFLAVAKKLNFSRAAESLYISQPALSLRINSLEDELGTKLFLRTRQQIYLTPAGSALLPEVQEILDRLDNLPELAKNSGAYGDAHTGKLSIALDDSIPESMLRKLVSIFEIFYRQYPEILVNIDSVRFDQYEKSLLTRQYDICMMGFKESDMINEEFNSFPIEKDLMVLAYLGDDLLTNEQLFAQRELLLLEGEDRWNAVLLNHLASKKIKPRLRTIRGGPALYVDLMRGKCVTFMPKVFFDTIGDDRLNYRELHISDDLVVSNLVWDKTNFNPAIQLMINCFEPLDKKES